MLAAQSGGQFAARRGGPSLVKIMRITGLDRRFLASQVSCRLVRA